MEITISLPYQQFALFRFKDAFILEKIHELIESCNGYEAALFFQALNNMSPLASHDDFSIGVVDGLPVSAACLVVTKTSMFNHGYEEWAAI